jgi:hypothetical protein
MRFTTLNFWNSFSVLPTSSMRSLSPSQSLPSPSLKFIHQCTHYPSMALHLQPFSSWFRIFKNTSKIQAISLLLRVRDPFLQVFEQTEIFWNKKVYCSRHCFSDFSEHQNTESGVQEFSLKTVTLQNLEQLSELVNFLGVFKVGVDGFLYKKRKVFRNFRYHHSDECVRQQQVTWCPRKNNRNR